ncbi:MAG: heme-binding protein [Geminicoccaceae bacterium]
MLKPFVVALTSLTLAGCSVFGVRSGTEQPAYSVREVLDDRTEIRDYAVRLAAQTEVPLADGRNAALNEAFGRLAGYIFGKNQGAREIAMTAPVEVARSQGTTIAMTAPVETVTEGQQMRMRFFLPAEIRRADAPTPVDPQVNLVEVPAEILAVRRFTGLRHTAAVDAQAAALLEAVRAAGYQPDGPVVSYFYDPPWTIPFLRRNEVAVAVLEPADARGGEGH